MVASSHSNNFAVNSGNNYSGTDLSGTIYLYYFLRDRDMKLTFDSRLYTAGAVKNAFMEFTGEKEAKIKRVKSDIIVELPEKYSEEEVLHFENMVLLFTIEEKRR